MSNTIPTVAQIRAALALLDWDNGQLSAAAGVSQATIVNVKMEHHRTREVVMRKIGRALESAGVEFTEMDGVRRRPQDIEVFVGPDRFEEFYDFLYHHLESHGGEVCMSTVNEKLFKKHRKNFEAHRATMKSLVESGKITVRVLATESNFTSTWAQYRWQEPQSAAPTAFYAFGDCLALISFDHPQAPYVVLHKSGPFAEAYRASFNIAWENGKTLNMANK